MKKLVALLLVSMMASMAFAGIDEDTDSMGVYFDAAGMNNCATAAPFAQFGAYLLLMNPMGTTDGFECTVTITPRDGAAFFALSTTPLGAGPVDVDPAANGFAVGVATPYVPADGALALVNWQILLTAPGGLDFFVTEAAIPSLPGDLPVVTGEGILRRCGVASGDVTLPVASVNGGCPVSEEVNSFGSVKSLFR